MHEIETPRLRLRMWRDSDVDELFSIYTDPEVARFLTPMRDRDDVATQIEGFARGWAERGYGQWATEEKESGRLIGRVGLLLHDDWPLDPGTAEMGWVLARPFWGRGFATEGLRAALRFGFDSAGLGTIVSIVPRDNVAARRLLEKLGLTWAGEARFRNTNVAWYAIPRDAWIRPG